MKPHTHPQQGSSLIEVLVAVLILSFGMLALGAMLSFAVQMPKLSGYRATATNLAASYIERIRANPDGFNANAYSLPLSYDGTSTVLSTDYCTYPACASDCPYPDCSISKLAIMDNAATQRAVRLALPAGGMILKCDPSPCTPTSNSYGNLWIVWQEPSTYAALNPTSSVGSIVDNCPTEVTGTYTDPKPRCLYVRFKI